MTDQTSRPGEPSRLHGWRAKVHEVIFETDTPAGKLFDVALIVTIMISVVVVSLESVPEIQLRYGPELRAVEWVITILFTIEYILRLLCVERPLAYATSFFGIVDLLAILPTFISVLVPGAQALTVVRVLRLLRIFRVLKLVQYVSEARTLNSALRASWKLIDSAQENFSSIGRRTRLPSIDLPPYSHRTLTVPPPYPHRTPYGPNWTLKICTFDAK